MRIVFTKVIDAGPGKARENITLYHEIDSIFAPHSKMGFVDGNWSTEVTHVTYDAGRKTFICRTSINVEIEISVIEGLRPEPIEDIVKRYLEEGWTSRVLV